MTAEEVSKKYIEAFFEDTNALNVKKATLNPTVMNTMDDIIAFVADLIDKGMAHESEGDVYFITEKLRLWKTQRPTHRRLTDGGQVIVPPLKMMRRTQSTRLCIMERKPNEISWNSPWGRGRPGWHIECSVMATKHLGAIDIHGGGQDLAFPHHENEIAQSESKQEKICELLDAQCICDDGRGENE